MDIIVKSQETRKGVNFRVLKDGKYVFAEVPFKNYFYIKTTDFESSKAEFYKKFNYCIDHIEEVKQLTKIYFSNNFMRIRMREFWEERANTFEADIKAKSNVLCNTRLQRFIYLFLPFLETTTPRFIFLDCNIHNIFMWSLNI